MFRFTYINIAMWVYKYLNKVDKGRDKGDECFDLGEEYLDKGEECRDVYI